MLSVRYFALLSLAALASAQTINVDACGVDCYNGSLNRAGSFNCAAHDMACLCPQPGFIGEISGCAQRGCPPGYEPTVTNAVSALCASFVAPPVPTSTAPPPLDTTTTAETPTTTSDSSSVAAPTTTTSDSSSSSAIEQPETSTATSAAGAAETASSATTAASSTSSTASAAGSASTSEAPDAAAGASSGLSEAAKIGIGIGVSAAVLALLGVAGCLFLRKRRGSQPSMPNHRYKISAPMPSSEHAYTHNNASEYDIGDGELEMKSHRYEDMLPRQQPRQMV
ncbi:GPI-anchored CFEM domain protein A [Madurella fahalii]|uniref:GPI-anchored CFEM domain protein A n=1 Tax=Madurella fahalii TaxID=1157608 RepID=A0ABQ0GPT5_9PEZI